MPDAAAFQGTRPVASRHAFDVEAVERFLAERIDGFESPLRVEQFRGGQSNPTFLLSTPSRRYVLRRKPPGQTLRTAHAVDREHRVISALAPQGIPVATPLVFCDDPSVMETPFYVMSYVEGRIFWDPTLPDVPASERASIYEAMGETLASLHLVDPVAAGLSDFGKPGDYFARQIARWSEQYRASRLRDIPAMERLMEWLAANPPSSTGRVSVIHGDYRLDNLIFHSTEPRILAIIDWELSTLGDPLADLSYQCAQWRLPAGQFGGLAGVERAALGIPSEPQYVAHYCERTGLPPVERWDAYLVYNMFRFAAILAGIARRAVDGTASSARAVEMGALVEPVAEWAWTLAKGT